MWEFILRCEVLEREGGMKGERARGRESERVVERARDSLFTTHAIYIDALNSEARRIGSSAVKDQLREQENV